MSFLPDVFALTTSVESGNVLSPLDHAEKRYYAIDQHNSSSLNQEDWMAYNKSNGEIDHISDLSPEIIDGLILETIKSLHDTVFVNENRLCDGAVLEKIKSLHDDDLKVSDNELCLIDGDNREKNITMTCEILECFLIPTLPQKKYDVTKIKTAILDIFDYKKAKQLINSVYSAYYDDGIKKFFAGCYLSPPGDGAQPKDVEVLDAAAFVLTACIHFKRTYVNDLNNDPVMVQTTDDLIESALDFIKKTVVEKLCEGGRKDYSGWCWGGKGKMEKYQYFTYAALDALIDFDDVIKNLSPKTAEQIIGSSAYAEKNKIAEQLRSVADSLLNELRNDERIQSGNRIKLFDDVKSEDVSSWYFNLWAIYSLLLTREIAKDSIDDGDTNKLTLAFQKLADIYINGANEVTTAGKSEFAEIEISLGDIDRKTKEVDFVGIWKDRSFCPMFMKCFSIYYTEFNRTKESDQAVVFIYNKLMNERDENTKLWDKGAVSRYSIYYTERSIEALVRLRAYLIEDIPKVTAINRQLRNTTEDKVSLPATIEISIDELRALVQPSSRQIDRESITLENLASLLRLCLQDLGEFKNNNYAKTEIDKCLAIADRDKKLGGTSLELASLIQMISKIGSDRLSLVLPKEKEG